MIQALSSQQSIELGLENLKPMVGPLLYVVQWSKNRRNWIDDKFFIPSPYSGVLDVLDNLSKFCTIPPARIVCINDEDATIPPIYYKR